VVEFKFTTSDVITDNAEVLFSGFPFPVTGINAFAHSLVYPESQKIIRLKLDYSNGNLSNYYTSGGIPAEQYEGFIVYITR
jgi:hypothetical protein